MKDVKHYKYSGNMLVFDPQPKHILAYSYEPKSKKLVKGTRGVMCHPSLQPKVHPGYYDPKWVRVSDNFVPPLKVKERYEGDLTSRTMTGGNTQRLVP